MRENGLTLLPAFCLQVWQNCRLVTRRLTETSTQSLDVTDVTRNNDGAHLLLDF